MDYVNKRGRILDAGDWVTIWQGAFADKRKEGLAQLVRPIHESTDGTNREYWVVRWWDTHSTSWRWVHARDLQSPDGVPQELFMEDSVGREGGQG